MSDMEQNSGCGCCGPDSGSSMRAGFAAGAQQLGIGGDEVTDLMRLFDAGDCPVTQARMADLVGARLAAAQRRGVEATGRAAAIQTAHGADRPELPAGAQQDIVTSLAAVARLQAAAARLADSPTPGRCDETCACLTAASARTAGVALTGDPAPDLVCTLDGGQEAMARRISDWTAVVGRATGRMPAEGGVTLRFDHDPEVTVELARLAAAEFDCCSFFTFTLTVGPDGMRFTVTAPEAAGDVVTAMFGTATPTLAGGS